MTQINFINFFEKLCDEIGVKPGREISFAVYGIFLLPVVILTVITKFQMGDALSTFEIIGLVLAGILTSMVTILSAMYLYASSQKKRKI